MTTHLKISNNGGTLQCDALNFNERLSCDPAKRNISLHSGGQYIDTDTYRFSEPITVKIKVRLTDSEKSTLENIFNANSECILTTTFDTGEITTYYGWLQSIQTSYHYRKESENITEWLWEVKLDFVCYDLEYAEAAITFNEPLDWGYFKNKGEIWFNQETGGYAGYPVYITDPFAEQGGGYFNK